MNFISCLLITFEYQVTPLGYTPLVGGVLYLAFLVD